MTAGRPTAQQTVLQMQMAFRPENAVEASSDRNQDRLH
jgi:hypothetical protein